MNAMVDIFASPSDAFVSIHRQRRWAVPGAIVVAVSLVITYLLMPFTQKIIFDQMAAQIGAEKASRTIDLVRRYEYMNFMLVPVMLALKWTVLSALLFSSAVLFNGSSAKFSTVFSLVVHAEFIQLFMGIVNIILLQVKGAADISTFSDLYPIVGLEYFFRTTVHDAAVLQFLKGVNIFNVWYLTVLTAGVAKICGIPVWKASVIVLVIWAGGALFQFMISTN